MKITVMTTDEQIVTLEVDRYESVENLKALLEAETQLPLQQQQLLYNGREMRNSEKLSALGVSDGDVIMMVATALSSGSRAGAPGNEVVGFNPDGSAVNPSAFQQQLLSDFNLMAQLFQKMRKSQLLRAYSYNEVIKEAFLQERDITRGKEKWTSTLVSEARFCNR